MKRDVVLSIQGRQHYGDQERETIELVHRGDDGIPGRRLGHHL